MSAVGATRIYRDKMEKKTQYRKKSSAKNYPQKNAATFSCRKKKHIYSNYRSIFANCAHCHRKKRFFPFAFVHTHKKKIYIYMMKTVE